MFAWVLEKLGLKKRAKKIVSMQHNHRSVETARKGHEIGIKVRKRVRVGDVVCRVVPSKGAK